MIQHLLHEIFRFGRSYGEPVAFIFQYIQHVCHAGIHLILKNPRIRIPFP